MLPLFEALDPYSAHAPTPTSALQLRAGPKGEHQTTVLKLVQACYRGVLPSSGQLGVPNRPHNMCGEQISQIYKCKLSE